MASTKVMGEYKRPCLPDRGCAIVVASPTDSRVWHVGTSSSAPRRLGCFAHGWLLLALAGNVGLGNHAINDNAPWHLPEYNNGVVLSMENAIYKPGMRSFFGAPCDPLRGDGYCSYEGEQAFPGELRHQVTCLPSVDACEPGP